MCGEGNARVFRIYVVIFFKGEGVEVGVPLCEAYPICGFRGCDDYFLNAELASRLYNIVRACYIGLKQF